MYTTSTGYAQSATPRRHNLATLTGTPRCRWAWVRLRPDRPGQLAQPATQLPVPLIARGRKPAGSTMTSPLGDAGVAPDARARSFRPRPRTRFGCPTHRPDTRCEQRNRRISASLDSAPHPARIAHQDPALGRMPAKSNRSPKSQSRSSKPRVLDAAGGNTDVLHIARASECCDRTQSGDYALGSIRWLFLVLYH